MKKFYFTSKKNISSFLEKHEIQNYYISFETAIKYHFSLKHPSNLLIIANDKIDLELQIEFSKIRFVKVDFKKEDFELDEEQNVNYQTVESLKREYLKDKEKFLSYSSILKDEVENEMEKLLFNRHTLYK